MSTSSRIGVKPNNDNTGRQQTYDYQAPVYAASIAILPTEGETTVAISLTGALTLTVGVGTATTAPYVGDKLRLILTPDGTNRTVTLSTGFAYTAATIVCTASKYAIADFVFNGAAWVEAARAITV